MSLPKEVRLSGTLCIRGPGQIMGNDHTLFTMVGNRARLELQGVSLHHHGSEQRPLRREKGAAVYAMAKAKVVVRHCTIVSDEGFGVWLAQRAGLDAIECAFADCGRSGIVAFGRATVRLVDSSIRNAVVHGICARGSTQISIWNTRISACGVRGVYAYHNASLEMRNTSVTGTQCEEAAAVRLGL